MELEKQQTVDVDEEQDSIADNLKIINDILIDKEEKIKGYNIFTEQNDMQHDIDIIGRLEPIYNILEIINRRLTKLEKNHKTI